MATVALVLGFLFNVLKVVFGLGFVIFVHELGHFLAAKWAGVKVEKFFLGFDFYGLRILSFRRGETLYGIGAIPLGGYVKMLGESGEGEAEAVPSDDPRAFSNKSVGARTVILSAGVVMNLLLGIVLFTVAYMAGVRENPARLGIVAPGSPAYEAGLRPGDEVVSIDGKPDANFLRLRLKVALSAANQTLHLGVKRPGAPDLVRVDVVPKRQAKSDQPTIGILPCESLTIYEEKPFQDPPPPGIDGDAPKADQFPKEGGTIVEAGPSGGPLAPVDDIFALDRVFLANPDKPVDIVIESALKGDTSPPTRTRVAIPVVRMLDFGLRMTPGPVASIQAGSIAGTAKFKKGDRIVRVEGRDFDPMRLPADLFARAGKPTTFTVERPADGKTETVELTAEPDDALPDIEPMLDPLDPLKIPGLGLAIEVEPKVASVAPGSPAEKVGIKPGDVLTGLTFPPAKDAAKGAKPKKVSLAKTTEKDVTEARWPYVFASLQATPRREVEVALAGSSKPVGMTPAPDPSWSNPVRGLGFLTVYRDLPPLPFGPSIRRAADQTYDDVIGIYAMIRSLFSGRMSTRNLAGLPRIAEISYHTARMGWVPLLQFLGMLSINLAVLNFLPIPPLDGGQIAFLVAEKIRGKPLPDSALTVLMIAGLVLVVVLMLFTILQDFYLMIFG